MVKDFIEIIADRLNNINNLTAHTQYNMAGHFIEIYVYSSDYQYNRYYIGSIGIDFDSSDLLRCYIIAVGTDNASVFYYSIYDFVDIDDLIGDILCKVFYG